MWWSYVWILVCLVWIVSCNTSFRCEREFSNNIANFGFTCWRLILAASGRGIILRLTIACLVTWDVLTLLWVWFLHIVLRYLLKVIIQLLHLLHLLLHPQLLRVCLNTLQALALSESCNVESLKRLTCFVGGRGQSARNGTQFLACSDLSVFTLSAWWSWWKHFLHVIF